jgi:hypothetical protein
MCTRTFSCLDQPSTTTVRQALSIYEAAIRPRNFCRQSAAARGRTPLKHPASAGVSRCDFRRVLALRTQSLVPET